MQLEVHTCAACAQVDGEGGPRPGLHVQRSSACGPRGCVYTAQATGSWSTAVGATPVCIKWLFRRSLETCVAGGHRNFCPQSGWSLCGHCTHRRGPAPTSGRDSSLHGKRSPGPGSLSSISMAWRCWARKAFEGKDLTALMPQSGPGLSKIPEEKTRQAADFSSRYLACEAHSVSEEALSCWHLFGFLTSGPPVRLFLRLRRSPTCLIPRCLDASLYGLLDCFRNRFLWICVIPSFRLAIPFALDILYFNGNCSRIQLFSQFYFGKYLGNKEPNGACIYFLYVLVFSFSWTQPAALQCSLIFFCMSNFKSNEVAKFCFFFFLLPSLREIKTFRKPCVKCNTGRTTKRFMLKSLH